MTTYISEALRRRVLDRAGGSCEYCLVRQRFVSRRHPIDHVYAEKHGGETHDDNLCLSCAICNLYKGTDICSIDPLTKEIVPLYHPLRQLWLDHFELSGAFIKPRTASARVTVRLLRLNDADRVSERERLLKYRQYP